MLTMLQMWRRAATTSSESRDAPSSVAMAPEDDGELGGMGDV